MQSDPRLCDIQQICELFGGDFQFVHELLLISKASLESCRKAVCASFRDMDIEATLIAAHKVKGIGLTIFSPCLVHASEILESNSTAALDAHVHELCKAIEVVESLILEWTKND